MSVRAISGSDTVVAGDDAGTILCSNTSTTAYTLAFTAAASLGSGFTVTVKKTDNNTNPIRLDPATTETIDGELTLDLDIYNETVTVTTDGSNWFITSHIQDAADPSITYISDDDVVTRVRKWLHDNPFEDVLDVALDLDDTAIDVGTPAQWAQAVVGEFEDGEQILFYRQPTAATGDIKRGHNDTTIATHAIGDVLLRNPRFPRVEIEQARDQVLASLWPDIWQALRTTITPETGTLFYEVPDDLEDAVSLVQKADNISTNYFWLNSKVVRGMPAVDFSNGRALLVTQFAGTDNDATLTYRAQITGDTITEGAVADCVVMGVCYRLLQSRDIARTAEDTTQGGSGVKPGDQLRTASFFKGEYDRARNRAKALLKKEHPTKREWRF